MYRQHIDWRLRELYILHQIKELLSSIDFELCNYCHGLEAVTQLDVAVGELLVKATEALEAAVHCLMAGPTAIGELLFVIIAVGGKVGRQLVPVESVTFALLVDVEGRHRLLKEDYVVGIEASRVGAGYFDDVAIHISAYFEVLAGPFLFLS